jgi:hypothetical protein
MKNKIINLALSAMLFAPCFSASAQQPAKIPRIAYLAGSPLSPISDGPMHSGRVCASSGTSRAKTLLLSGGARTEIAIASERSQPS